MVKRYSDLARRLEAAAAPSLYDFQRIAFALSAAIDGTGPVPRAADHDEVSGPRALKLRRTIELMYAIDHPGTELFDRVRAEVVPSQWTDESIAASVAFGRQVLAECGCGSVPRHHETEGV